MDQTIPPAISCHNCKTVTTDNGQTVWVCERCGEENHVATEEEKQAQAMIDAAAAATPTPVPAPVAPVVPVVPPQPVQSSVQN